MQVVQKTSAVKDKGPAPSHSGQQQTGSSQNKGKAPTSAPKPSNDDDKKKKKNRRAPRRPNACNAIESVSDNDDHRFEIARPTILHPHSLRNRIEPHTPDFTLGDYLPREIPPHVPSSSVASISGSRLTIRTSKEQKPWKAPGNAPYPVYHKAKSLADRIGITPTIQTVKNLEVVVRDSQGDRAYDEELDIPMEVEKNYEDDYLVSPCQSHYSDDDDEEDSLFPGCDMAARLPSRAPTPEPAPAAVECERLLAVRNAYNGRMDIDQHSRSPSPIAPWIAPRSITPDPALKILEGYEGDFI